MFKFLRASMSIDIGSDFIRMFTEDQENVWSERSVIAIYTDQNGNETVLATGKDALDMEDRVPKNIIVYRPFMGGKIEHFNAALLLIRHMIIEIQGRLLWMAPKVRVALHHDASLEEKKSYTDLLTKSGMKQVTMVNRSFASAIGADVPIDEACGYMVVNIGACATEISVIALERVAFFNRIHIGGRMIDKAIISYLEKKHNDSCRANFSLF